MPEKLLTLSEAAVLLGISERTIRKRISNGEIQAKKVSTGRGVAWRIPEDALGEVEVSERESEGLVEVSERESEGLTERVAEVSASLQTLQEGVDTRLSRIEGVLAGQFSSEVIQRLQELTNVVHSLEEKAAQREATLRKELAQTRAVAEDREKELTQRLDELRQVMEQPLPWWKRLLGKGRENR